MEEIVLSGVKISVTKKSIKNMYLRVLPPDGRVQITAPSQMSDASIRAFAASKIPWIKKHKKYFAQQPAQAGLQYDTGERCFLWGQSYLLEVRHSDANPRVSLEGEKLVLAVEKGSTPWQREQVLNEWYRAQMKQAVPDLLKKCEGIVGVGAEEWRIKNMRTRWGTCNIQKRRIWLNLQLAKKAPECLEYVMIHELVHLLEKNHNDRFYGYMDRFYPNWREVKERLNQSHDCFIPASNEENSRACMDI